MAEFLMPSLGADMTGGTLVKWLVVVGGHVTRGDIIAEVETDKGTIQVEVFESGVVEALLVQEGEKVPVGTPLATIASDVASARTTAKTKDASLPEPGTTLQRPTPAPVYTSPPASSSVMTRGPTRELGRPMASPATRRRAQELDVPLDAIEGTGSHGRITQDDVERSANQRTLPARSSARRRVSPYARRLAKERGIPLEDVRGTGPDGAIRADDVTRAASKHQARPARERMQRAISAAMARANEEIPHYYVEHTIDMAPSLEWLRARNETLPIADRLVPSVLFLRAVARALHKHPRLNATWQKGVLVPSDGNHVGLAVTLRGGGLVVPAIRDADHGSVNDLMGRMTDVVSRARAGVLRSSEMATPGITLTALGERGAEGVIPLIFPPQVAIVGVGAVLSRPWVVEDQVVPRQVVRVTLGADHRVTNGHEGARFVRALDRLMQTPEGL